MAQYIDKTAVVAEIKRLIDCCYKICAGNLDFLQKSYPEHYYSIETYKEILSFLDTLEVKEVQEEPVSNDLEKAAWTYYDKNKPLIPHELDLHKEMISFFIAGAQWQKEQMIKNAVEAVIHPYDGEIWVDKDLLSIYDDCQRVKLIIIKEK